MRGSRLLTVGVAAVVLAIGGSFAYAAIPNSDGSVSACYANTNAPKPTTAQVLSGKALTYSKGDVRVVAAGEACRSYETAISLASADALATLRSTVTQQDARIAALEANRFDPSRFYTRTTGSGSVGPGGTLFASARCDDYNDIAISGGYDNADSFHIVHDHWGTFSTQPGDPQAGGQEWVVGGVNTSDHEAGLFLYVTCLQVG